MVLPLLITHHSSLFFMTLPIFLHIEHTGGTTLHTILDRQYGDGLYYVPRPSAVEGLRALTPEQKASTQAVWGHFSYGVHRYLPQDSQYFALIRDPVNRAVASYYYEFRFNKSPNHAKYLSGEIGWPEHIAKSWVTQTQISRLIGGDEAELTKHRPCSVGVDAVAQAQANIETHFAFVGLTEYYDESLLLMARLCGWTKPLHYIRRNTGERKDTPPGIREQLIDLTTQERAVYDWAKTRFLALVESQGAGFQREVAEFKAANAAYATRHNRLETIKARLRPLWRKLRGK